MQTLDPGLRRDDDFRAGSFQYVIPAYAGIERLGSTLPKALDPNLRWDAEGKSDSR